MSNINKANLPIAIFLMGPTSSGKTSLATKLHKILPVELISVDSALVYKGMNIGTAKPSEEELRITPHKLLNIIDPAQTYSVADFCHDALIEMNKIVARNNIPLLVGGTMFYYKALLHGLSLLPSANHEVRLKIKQQAAKYGWAAMYQQLTIIDPVTALMIHPNDLQRLSRALEIFFISGKTLTALKETSRKKLPYRVYQFAIIPTNRELLYHRIEQRFYHMLATGFEKEVRELFARKDLHADMPSIRCVGYRQMWSWLEGVISYNEMIYQSICITRQLAKRQMTWLRNWKEVIWLDSEKQSLALNTILRIIKKANT